MLKIIQGDALEKLRELPDESVHLGSGIVSENLSRTRLLECSESLHAILTVGPNTIPDQGSTFLLLTLGLLSLVTFRRQLLRGQP